MHNQFFCHPSLVHNETLPLFLIAARERVSQLICFVLVARFTCNYMQCCQWKTLTCLLHICIYIRSHTQETRDAIDVFVVIYRLLACVVIISKSETDVKMMVDARSGLSFASLCVSSMSKKNSIINCADLNDRLQQYQISSRSIERNLSEIGAINASKLEIISKVYGVP